MMDGRTRRENETIAAVAGILRHVQSTFLAPAVAMALVGGTLAPIVDFSTLIVHATAVGLAVYVAHLRDGYVDRFVREEEPPAGMTPSQLRAVLVVSSVGFFTLVVVLWHLVGLIGVLATVPLWILGIVHAPYLDTGPIGVTVDYAVGVAIAVTGGYAVQTRTVSATVLATALVYFLFLSAVKISLDRLDWRFDRSIGKRTVPVVLGTRAADRLASGIHLVTAGFLLAIGIAGLVPTLSATAAVFVLFAALAVRIRPRRRAVQLQIVLAYPFAVLFVLGLCLGTPSACGTVIDAAAILEVTD